MIAVLCMLSMQSCRMLQESLSGSTCRIVNSPSRQHAPLLTVMQYYTLKVRRSCPALTSSN